MGPAGTSGDFSPQIAHNPAHNSFNKSGGSMVGSFARRLMAAALMALAVLAANPAAAQGPRPSETVASALDVKTARSRLDSFKAELDQTERALQARELPDPELQRLRSQIDPVAEAIRALIDDLAPRLDTTRARLEQLGPKPKDGQPEESADATKERAEREAAVAELDETQRLSRALLVQAEQLRTLVSDRRRAGFTRALFEQSAGILSPDLWLDVVQALPRELWVMQTVLTDAAGWLQRRATFGSLLLVGLAVGAAIALYAGRRHVAPRLVARDPAALDPPHRSRLLAAIAVLLLGAVPAVAGSWLVWTAFDAMDLLPPRLEPVIAAVLRGLAFVAFVRALVDAVLAPGHRPWRLVAMSDVGASRILTFTVVLGFVIALGKVVDSFSQAVAAALPISVASRAIFALACALLLADLLRRFASVADAEDSDVYAPRESELGGPVRIVGWTIVAAITASILAGYVALASFLIDQVLWISVLLALLLLSIALVDDLIGNTLKGQTKVATTLQANTGLRRRSLEQIGVLTNGLARLVLILAALLLGLAPWGVESSDVVSSLRAAFFGFKVGDVTISLSAIIIAGLLFALGFGATRMVQRWLDSTFLPATDLDAGLRNSIRTGFGYVGIIVAAAVSFSYLGLSLDRLTIVAGALSVGIGFGLQSIVNNFVSGLILLWERPIRVGDLVVVGDGEGYVRHINVRATEIETFDRSTILVPNSNLISGVVRNRVRSDRTGRVIVTIPAPRFSDPDQVAAIMRNAALAHREVMSEPTPRVLFKKVTDQSLEFDLVCFVDEVDAAARVSSDLYFAAYRGLREQGIIQPPPQSSILVDGLHEVSGSLKGIASAIELHTAPAKTAPKLPEGVPLPIIAPKAEARPGRSSKPSSES
jgi:small-conductance mechanosensitive channel